MEYRDFGRAGRKVSALSIGAMRLPEDVEEAAALVRRAIDAGCNYIDTCRWYGDSERKVARALKDGYRDRVILSTKSSPWIHREEGYTADAASTRRMMDSSMERLEVDRLDYYQVWNVTDRDSWDRARARGNMVDGIREAIAEGIVGEIGVTTHAPEDVALEMIDSGIFATVTVSYHLLSRGRAAVIERAAARGMGVVVMNPMAGGLLGFESPTIAGFTPGSGRSSKELALRFVLDTAGVSTAICGFSKPSDVEENVAAEAVAPLTAEELATAAAAAAGIEEVARRFCTQCGYCMPCPQGVNIKEILDMANRGRLLGLEEWARGAYARIREEQRADHCVHCGECVEKCTNGLDIPAELERAHAWLTAGV